jgi:nicotinic acid mononucleotide adenylyltransferase
MTRVQINLHDRKQPSTMAFTDLPRVPVVGDEVEHEGTIYTVSTVMFSTNGDMPYIVAKVPLR